MKVYTPQKNQEVIMKPESSIFLAGGISNCPDWQSKIIPLFKDTDVTLFNPRRPFINFLSEEESSFQIEWEVKYLTLCHKILFWFPKESICPITLFELGMYSDKNIFIGVEKGYTRSYDVKKQMELARSDIEIVDSLETLVLKILEEN